MKCRGLIWYTAIALWLLPIMASAQRRAFFADYTTFNASRLRLSLGGVGGGYVAGYTYLGLVWYADNKLTGFHWFNDWSEWRQVDKCGHAYGAYQQSRAMISLLRWSGASRAKYVLWGSLTGVLLQSPVEIMDGLADKWGASAGDLLFNAAGSGLALTNELLWREQRLQYKFAFWPSSYADQRPDALGSGASELLKDYNGQTYWLSYPVKCLLPNGALRERTPRWLCLSVGYGANGLLGGYGQDPPGVIRAREYRQWYIGPDIDLTRLGLKPGFWRTFFGALNAIRLPLPAVSFSRHGVEASWFGN